MGDYALACISLFVKVEQLESSKKWKVQIARGLTYNSTVNV